MPKTLEELLKDKEKAEAKLADIKTRLGHPHLDFMSVHDLAESEFHLWSAILADIEQQLLRLKLEKRGKTQF